MKASNNGYSQSMYSLAGLIMDNANIDDRLAYDWMLKATKVAEPLNKAFYGMGVFYEYGVGVAKNLVAALDWYKKARDNNVPDAEQKIKDLEYKINVISSDSQTSTNKSNLEDNKSNVNDNNRSYNYISNDSINNNNFYNYALHNNINNNIINNNIINNIPEVRDISNSYIPETFGKSIDYSNPINFQSEAFGIYIEREKLEVRPRKLNLNSSSIITTINYTHKEVKEINTINNSDHNNKETINNNNLNNNFSEINETPKFSNKKRYRGKNDSSTGVKTCPTTNSSNRLKKAVPVVNKNIKKKKLNLN